MQVIDALVVSLNLDTKQFNDEQKKALEALRKFQVESEGRAKSGETEFNRFSNAIGGLKRQALGLLGVFMGAKGLTEFVANTVRAGSEVGRLSRAIGVSASEIAKWQGLAREFGSTPEAMANSFKSLSDVFTAWQVGGPEAPQVMQMFRLIETEARRLNDTGAKTIDINKGVAQSYLDLADNLKIIHDLSSNKNLASYLAGKIPGMDPGMFDALIQGGDKLSDTLKKINGWTDAEAEAAGRLQRRWDGLLVSAENLGLKALFGTVDAAKYYLVTPEDGKKPSTFTEPSVNSTSVQGGFTSQAQKEAFIRQQAIMRGINPDAAMAVARSEGFNTFKSTIPGEESYSSFQLNMGKGAQGDLFQRATGLDPRDPKNEAQAIIWALNDVKKTGWSHYHGAANGAHLSTWQGIDRNAPNAPSGGGTTMEFNAPITVNGVQDAKGFSAGLRQMGLQRQADGNQASVGGE